VAFDALPHLQQVATLDGTSEVGDRHFVTTASAPDVGQQLLTDVSRNRLSALTGWLGESRQ
jgi:hypothetical protein